jgi:hypothetical protein
MGQIKCARVAVRFRRVDIDEPVGRDVDGSILLVRILFLSIVESDTILACDELFVREE